MKFCPECGQYLNEMGTCDYCGFPEVKIETLNNDAIGVVDQNSMPRYGLYDNSQFENILENEQSNPKTSEEITSDMLKTLEKLGFVSKEEDIEK